MLRFMGENMEVYLSQCSIVVLLNLLPSFIKYVVNTKYISYYVVLMQLSFRGGGGGGGADKLI